MQLPQSIVGEDLPYIFGAPLASAGPFQSRYSPEERLLSEAIMVYWTNFAKTGYTNSIFSSNKNLFNVFIFVLHFVSNPKAPWREHFLNLEPKDWEHYDIDWPEFNGNNLNYLNIGVPPVVNQKYKYKYMNFWNQELPDELNRTINLKPIQPYPELYAVPPTAYPRYNSGTSNNHQIGGGSAHINYFPEKSTEDPFRALKFLLNRPNLNRTSDMYNTQSSLVTTTATDVTVDGGINSSDNQIIVKADATLNILIAIVITFLLINVIIILIYVVRRNYYSKNLKRKLDVLTLDGTTDEDAKRSKFQDGDESYILDMVRKKNEYEPVQRNRSPINGFLLSRQLSTSTVDAHTKVCDWMSQEITKQNPKNKKTSPNFSLKSRSFFRRPGKVNVAIDATPTARSASILAQQPAELMASQTYDYDTKDMIICQEVDVDASMIDPVNLRDSNGNSSFRRNSIASLKGSADIIKIDHRHSRSDPVQMYYRKPSKQDEDITVFIEDVDINVTSRDEHIEREPLTPEEALKTMQMRNYPKVLPNYPENMKDYVSSSMKRRSLPPQYFSMNPALKTPPAPPPRTTSTLGRRPSTRRQSKDITTSPIMMAEEPPVEEEPEITCNILHVGPIIPKSNESLYSTIKKQPPKSPVQPKHFSFENSITIENIPPDTEQNELNKHTTIQPDPPVHRPTGIKPPSGQKPNTDNHQNNNTIDKKLSPKIIIKPTLCRQNSSDKKKSNGHIPRVQAPQDTSTIATTSGNIKPTSGSKIPTIKKSMCERDRSASDSSTETSSSSAETVKKIF